MNYSNIFFLNLPASLNDEEKKKVEFFIEDKIKQLRKEELELLSRLKIHHERTVIHSIMVALDVDFLSRKMNYSKEKIEDLTIAALLHDTGKLRIHKSILDLGGFDELEKIWNFSYTNKPFPKNALYEINVIDFIKYKSKLENDDHLTNNYVENYLKWMEKNEVTHFLDKSIRAYLEHHQEGTRIELKKIGTKDELINYAAAHHPLYYDELKRGKIEKETKIIEIADKFNAIMQTEGIRYYATKKTKQQAINLIIESFEDNNKSDLIKKFEEEIINILVEKYFTKEEIYEKSKSNKMANKINDNNLDKIFPCQIPQLKLSCYGCCGRSFKSKKDVEEDIKNNTLDFKQIKTPSTFRLLQFRDRLSENPDVLTKSGVCSNLVDFKDNCVACPLHYAINEIVSKDKFLAIHKKDLRFNHCDINFECETFIFWKHFSEKQKREYLEYLSKQNYDKDLYLYSTENLDGIMIKKFMDEKNYKSF